MSEKLNTPLIIKNLMRENNWNIQDIFLATGVARSTISRWINGKSQMTLEQIQLLIEKSRNEKNNSIGLLMADESVHNKLSSKNEDDDFFLDCKDKKCQSEIIRLRKENDTLKDKLIKLQEELLNYKTK